MSKETNTMDEALERMEANAEKFARNAFISGIRYGYAMAALGRAPGETMEQGMKEWDAIKDAGKRAAGGSK